MTDGRTDGRTDRRTDGRTDGGDCNIPYAFLKKRGDNDILQIYEQDRLRKCKISTRCNPFHVFYLNGNNKICFC